MAHCSLSENTEVSALRFSEFFVLISLVLCLSCATTDEEYAKTETYYVLIADSVRTTLANELVDSVRQSFSRERDFILTETSASKGWPYFDEVNFGEPVRNSRIMKPHKTVHRLKLLDDRVVPKAGDKLLQLELLECDTTYVIFRVRGFRWQNQEWDLIVNAGAHSWSNRNHSDQSMSGYMEKEIIRTSFK